MDACGSREKYSKNDKKSIDLNEGAVVMKMIRENLRNARINKGITQQKVADYLEIGLRYYQKIETGDRTGDFKVWDKLEDLFNIHQRKLREIADNHHGREDNP